MQAARLLESWQDDPEIDAWLVPDQPGTAPPVRRAAAIRYVRTVVTQLSLLAAAVPRAPARGRRPRLLRVVLVVPARAPAGGPGRPAAGQAGRDELPQRRGAGPSEALGYRARRLRHVDRNVVPSAFLQDVFAGSASTPRSSRTSSMVRRFAFRDAEPLRPERAVHAQLREALQPAVHACVRSAGSRTGTRSATLDAGRRRDSQEPAIRALAEEPAPSSGATFAGRVPPEEIWRYYADADIYLQTPDIDNMPSSVLEAFASGCAVVSTDAGGVPAILTNGVHGLLVPCNDDEGAAERDAAADRGCPARPTVDRRGARELRALSVDLGSRAVARALSRSGVGPGPRAPGVA